jgi:hypothetical protein
MFGRCKYVTSDFNRRPTILAIFDAGMDTICESKSKMIPSARHCLPWPGPPLRTERMCALGTPSNASSIRDRAHPTTLSPTGPDSPRVTLISPVRGMSVPHLVDINSPRVTVISPFPGMSSPPLVDVYSPRVTVISPRARMTSPHLVDVNSPRVTMISPFAGMSSPHLVDVYCPLVTLVSPFPGKPVSHLANVYCSLYILKTIT